MSKQAAEFWVLVSGKGGVGKSVLTMNMGIALSLAGKRVLLLDTDLGLANLHVLANVEPRDRLERVLGRASSLQDAVTPLPGGPHLLAADNGQSLSLLDATQASDRLAETLGQLHAEYDYVLVDTPRGISESALQFCRACDRTLLVTSDEPTALTNTYAWFKISCLDGSAFPVWLVANGTADESLPERFGALCQRFLGRQPLWGGRIPADPAVPRAVASQQSLFEIAPDAPAWAAVQKLVTGLQAIDTQNVPMTATAPNRAPGAPRSES